MSEVVQVDAWTADGSAEVRYRGATWQAVTRSGSRAGGPHRVIELQGNRLVLEPASPSSTH